MNKPAEWNAEHHLLDCDNDDVVPLMKAIPQNAHSERIADRQGADLPVCGRFGAHGRPKV